MCQETPTNETTTVATGTKKDEAEDHEVLTEDKAEEPVEDEKKKVEHYAWWRGGGIKPQSGHDLGVWEESLEDRANCLSLWWMSYLNPLLRLGSLKVLDGQDVGVPSKQDRADRAYESAKKEWENQLVKCHEHNELAKKKWTEQQKQLQIANNKNKTGGDTSETTTEMEPIPESKLKEPSMSVSLVVSFGGWRIALAILFQVISAMLSFVPVIILNDLVRYFEWYNATSGEGTYDYLAPPWVEVVGLGIIPFVVSILQTRHNAIMAHCGVFVRTAVSTLLYRKALTVSAAGRAKTSTGQVVNMMSNGTYKK
jgi:hypothetical protein